MEAHEGQVSYRTRLGVGTTFELLMPSLAAAAESPDEVREVAQTGSARVLIMDDELDQLEVISELLPEEGPEVGTAADGEQASASYAETA